MFADKYSDFIYRWGEGINKMSSTSAIGQDKTSVAAAQANGQIRNNQNSNKEIGVSRAILAELQKLEPQILRQIGIEKINLNSITVASWRCREIGLSSSNLFLHNGLRTEEVI